MTDTANPSPALEAGLRAWQVFTDAWAVAEGHSPRAQPQWAFLQLSDTERAAWSAVEAALAPAPAAPVAEDIGEEVEEQLRQALARFYALESVEWMRSQDIDRLQAAEAERDRLKEALRGCRTNIAGYNLRDGSEVRRLLDEFFNELQRIDGVARAALAGGKA